MQSVIIGLSGKANSGKDTAADYLEAKHRFIKISLADPLKRISQEIFGFTDQQLWGPSQYRNEPDKRYVRMPKGSLGSTYVFNKEQVPSPEEDIYLTPRYALQQLGTEYGRGCYEDVWIDYAIRTTKSILTDGWEYSPKAGILPYRRAPPAGVAIPDVRFKNEIQAIRAAGGLLIRIRRPTAGLPGAAGEHASEAEQDQIPDSEFDAVVKNEEDIPAFHILLNATVIELMRRKQNE